MNRTVGIFDNLLCEQQKKIESPHFVEQKVHTANPTLPKKWKIPNQQIDVNSCYDPVVIKELNYISSHKMIKFKTFLVNKKLSWGSDWRKEKVWSCDTCYMHKWYMEFEHTWVTMVSNLFEFTGMQIMANIFCAEIQNHHNPPRCYTNTHAKVLCMCLNTNIHSGVQTLTLHVSLCLQSVNKWTVRASKTVVAQMATVVLSWVSNKSGIELYRPPTLLLNSVCVCVC